MEKADSIKEKPIGVYEYYKSAKKIYNEKAKECNDKLEDTIKSCSINRDKILRHSKDLEDYGIFVNSYPEVANNKYINGELEKDAKEVLDKLHYKEDEEEIGKINYVKYLYKYAKTLKDIIDLSHKHILYNKIANLSLTDYCEYLKTYAGGINKELILNGNAVKIANIGLIIVNRYDTKSNKRKVRIDFEATKLNKKKILAEGGRLWNKKEEEYYKNRGLEYNGVDYRVYKKNEPESNNFILLTNHGNPHNLKMSISTTRDIPLKLATNEEIKNSVGGDLNKLMFAHVGPRTKLSIATNMDPTLNILYKREYK